MENLTIDGLKQQAEWLLDQNRTDMRWFANRGWTNSCAVAAALTLRNLGLIDKCDYWSFINEYTYRIRRYAERIAEGLPVLGH